MNMVRQQLASLGTNKERSTAAKTSASKQIHHGIVWPEATHLRLVAVDGVTVETPTEPGCDRCGQLLQVEAHWVGGTEVCPCCHR